MMISTTWNPVLLKFREKKLKGESVAFLLTYGSNGASHL